MSDPDLFDALAAALPLPLPVYDPLVEITVADLARRQNWGVSKAGRWLAAEVAAGRWVAREVKVNGRPAKAYRPTAK